MRDIEPIHNADDYALAMKEVEAYFENQPAPGTEEGKRFEVLCDLVELYEDRNYPIPASDPVRVLHFAIENMGRSQAELGHLIGRTRASEILNRRRALTIDQIRKISEAWHLPIATLTPRYALVEERELA